MAIVGVEPVSYLEIGEDNKTEIYTRNQVREILIKHTAELLEYPFINTPEPDSYGKIVDEFMKTGDQDNELFKMVGNRIEEY